MPLGILAGMNESRASSWMPTDLSVPATVKLAAVEHDVVLGGFHQVGGDLVAFGDDLSAAVTSAVPPTTAEREPNVPVPIATWSVSPHLKPTRVGTDAELVGDDLAERGLMALAVVMRAHQRR